MKFTFRYGIDAPFWVIFLIVLGAGGFIVSMTGLPQSIGGLVFGLYMLVTGLWMFLYSTVIKIMHRHVILNLAQAHAGDKVLDVGTGRGLLAIAAANMGCKVTAIDKWSQWDLAGNGRDALLKNARDEGVPHIEVVDGDVQELPFADECFDVVVSNFVIHNIKSAGGRARAIQEMWRVLRPNGHLVISDISRTQEYVQILSGLTDHITTERFFYTFPFSRVVVAQKRKLG
ncbi:type 11 methyltransferase [Collibacillus ludicampi]|uniref:Type 11 methyltransferase n=1 Tax=Collibacillus ludicampi TaxID=2771369 RepID=A0AAV4LFM3_9BACL|nr:class I SAM-dependent methyltransferase [Collibacillus ludicampi]GIM46655.1 type 11 methyltransferase [Collibacillus ludicampi]